MCSLAFGERTGVSFARNFSSCISDESITLKNLAAIVWNQLDPEIIGLFGNNFLSYKKYLCLNKPWNGILWQLYICEKERERNNRILNNYMFKYYIIWIRHISIRET